MKRINGLILSVFLGLSVPSVAQNWDEIQYSKEYLTGYGYGATVAEADQAALADLISKISIEVKSDFEQTEEETNKNGNIDSEAKALFRVKSYSQATLTNTERLIVKNEPDAEVARYVKKTEVNRIFEGRKNKVTDMIETAQKAEGRGKVDDALRYYYWAYTLLRSVPHSNEVTYLGRVLTVWIPQQMNRLFDDIRAQVVGRDGGDITLQFTFRGNPVSSLDYTYFDGAQWSSIYSAKDGLGVLELSANAIPDNVQLKFEYEYRGEARIDKEIENVINIERSIAMRKAYLTVPLKRTKVAQPVPEHSKAEETAVAQKENHHDNAIEQMLAATKRPPTEVSDGEKYQAVIDKVVAAIKTKNQSAAIKYFTSEGAEIFRALIQYGQAKVIGDSKCRFYPYRDWVMARSVPMSFSFRNGMRKSFVEDVVFTFEPSSGKICNITFGLGKTAEKDILNKGVWEESFRMQIIDFMENYKTAYALKRLDYLESIFADDAIIITGRVVKHYTVQKQGDNRVMNMPKTEIKYTRQNKAQFIKSLAASFRSKEFINLRFSDNEVNRSGKNPNIFGIQIHQDYYSSNYGDTGYLFLMVDMEKPEEPLIKIRTWQPEKDKEIGVYSIGHF